MSTWETNSTLLFFARRWSSQRFRADFDRMFGTFADVARHERSANRALVALRVLLALRRAFS